jgi:hypothetical protein
MLLNDGRVLYVDIDACQLLYYVSRAQCMRSISMLAFNFNYDLKFRFKFNFNFNFSFNILTWML